MNEKIRNKIYCGDAIEIMRKYLPDECIQTVVTSPPYWGLRAYAGDQDIVWGGDSNCVHEWGDTHTTSMEYVQGNPEFERPHREQKNFTADSNICQLCGAWRGSLGLEPTPEMYVEHIVEIFREVKRVLRKDGTLWLNIASTYISTRMESAEMVLRDDLTGNEVEYVLKELAKHARTT